MGRAAPRLISTSDPGEVAERFRLLFKHTLEPVVIYFDDEVVDANPAALQLLNAPDPSAVIGRSPLRFLQADDHPRAARRLQQMMKTGEGVPPERFRLITLDGRPLEVEGAAVPIPFHGATAIQMTMRDVTAHQRAEEAQQRWRTLIQQASDGIFIFRLEGDFVEVNHRACEMTGYEQSELMAMHPEDLIIGRAEGDPEEAWRQLEAGETLRFTRDILCKTGRTFTADVSVRVVGESLVQAIIRDVSEREQHERDLIEAKERAEEMNRLKTVFLANISHEVRTPMSAILGLADTLRTEVSGTARELAGLIRLSGQRLMDTFNSVLDLAQLESGSLELQPALLRVLSNLLANAVKFTHEGHVELRLNIDGDDLELQVEDTGIGIDGKFLPHVFEDFRQESSGLARDYEGNGLGLGITRRLVALMGGGISVESEKGRGTTFSIVLPRGENHGRADG